MIEGKIILAGGTGFIGQELIKHFGKTNRIVVLSRGHLHAINNRHQYSHLNKDDLQNVSYIHWDGRSLGPWSKEFEGAACVINLAGKSVNCRYTPKNKKEILESRVFATEIIGEAIRHCDHPPKLWINSSSATIYREARDRPQDEYTGETGNGFSVDVCKGWEKAFDESTAPLTRKVALRLAITLGAGGVLIPYFNLLKFGLGGTQGNGNQRFSWVHNEDVCGMIEWIAEHPELVGKYNCSSPHPVPNREFMKKLRQATGHRLGLPAPAWMLKMGAWMIGTETELILKSRWVVPTRILDSGFQFRFPYVEDAFTDIISKVPKRQYRLFGI